MAAFKLAEAEGAKAIAQDERLTADRQVVVFHDRLKRRIHVWTVNGIGDIRRLAEWDVDGIITADPSLALDVAGRLV